MGGDEKVSYHDQDCVTRLVSAGVQGVLCGAFFGAAQQAFSVRPTMLRQTTISEAFKLPRQQAMLFGLASAVFATTECLANSIMGENKLQGTALGGFAMGATVGILKGNVQTGVGIGITVAAVGCATEWMGYGSLLRVPQTERNLAKWRILPQADGESH